MKNFIVIILAAVVLNFVNGVKFDEVDVYDDYEELKERSDSEGIDVKEERPNYDINDAPDLFLKFVNDYNKQYKSEKDYNQHYMNFVKNLEEINAHNKEGTGSISGINMFADYSDEELAKLSG